MSEKDKRQKTSISMRSSTWRDVDATTNEVGLPSRSSTIEMACKLFIKHYRAGQVVMVAGGFELAGNPVTERNQQSTI